MNCLIPGLVTHGVINVGLKSLYFLIQHSLNPKFQLMLDWSNIQVFPKMTPENDYEHQPNPNFQIQDP